VPDIVETELSDMQQTLSDAREISDEESGNERCDDVSDGQVGVTPNLHSPACF
jgi:hypothetical protein